MLRTAQPTSCFPISKRGTKIRKRQSSPRNIQKSNRLLLLVLPGHSKDLQEPITNKAIEPRSWCRRSPRGICFSKTSRSFPMIRNNLLKDQPEKDVFFRQNLGRTRNDHHDSWDFLASRVNSIYLESHRRSQFCIPTQGIRLDAFS